MNCLIKSKMFNQNRKLKLEIKTVIILWFAGKISGSKFRMKQSLLSKKLYKEDENSFEDTIFIVMEHFDLDLRKILSNNYHLT